MNQRHVFDLEHYQALNQAREASVRELLAELQPALDLRTAVDVGCGLGHFSGFLRSLGLHVSGLDGRRENMEEARRRFPDISFRAFDVEDPALADLGGFDLVFCFGLLYHLENPFRAIRHLHAMTAKLLLVEGICVPGPGPILLLRDEGPSEDQGLNHVALYPSEASLVKMSYRAGFRFVYRFANMPDHPLFHRTFSSEPVRTMLAASHVPLNTSLLALAPEPSPTSNPWETGWAKLTRAPRHMWGFLLKPWPEKLATLRRLAGQGER